MRGIRPDIAFVGDINPGGLFYKNGTISDKVANILNSAELRVGTLESAFGDGSFFCPEKMSSPTGGNIVYAPEDALCLLKQLNINLVTLANNHSCDCGIGGLYKTLERLDQLGIAHIGAGRTKEEAERPYTCTINGNTFCFLAYYPTQMRSPYPPDKNNGGMNQLIIDKVIDEIKLYKSKYDYVIVMPHWSAEHTIWPDIRYIEYSQKMIDAGCDMIMASHPHQVHPVFHKKKSIVATSLGNFIFSDWCIRPPRISFYPENPTLLPIVHEYKIVQTESLYKISKANKLGCICTVKCSRNGKINNSEFYTFNNDNVIELVRHPYLSYSVQLKLMKYILSFGQGFELYRFVNRLRKAILRRIR